MKAQFADRPGFWEQPATRRDQYGNTWTILRISQGNPEIVTETTVGDIADMLRGSLDRLAIDELVTQLEARFPAPDIINAMSDLALHNLAEDAGEAHQAATQALSERHPGGDVPSREDRMENVLLRKAIACVIRMSPDHEHCLEHHHDGDGWNEPFTDHYACICGHVVAEWTQSDPSAPDGLIPRTWCSPGTPTSSARLGSNGTAPGLA